MSEATQGENTAPSIGIQDLQILLQIVDLSAKRGTFEGSELSTVGSIRDKLATFVEFARATEEAQRAASEEANADESAEESTPDAPAKPARGKRKAS
jgi:hypothetical protein